MDPLSESEARLDDLTEEMRQLASQYARLAQQAAEMRKELIMQAGRLPTTDHLRAIVAECFLCIAEDRNQVPIMKEDEGRRVPFVAIPRPERLNEVFFAKMIELLAGHLGFQARRWPAPSYPALLVQHTSDGFRRRVAYYIQTLGVIVPLDLQVGMERWKEGAELDRFK